MIGRIVEIAEDRRHLALHRGFMTVMSDGAEIGRVALDDIAVVVANAHGLTYSNNLLTALCERGAIMVLCGRNHSPVAWVWPLEGHHLQAAHMRAQIGASRPLCKRLWQLLVRAKIEQQAAALEALDRPGSGLRAMAGRVRSGDPENLEAQAARRYWRLLFGDEFRRDRKSGGLNSMLNYGYTVMRAAAARSVVAAGLHPSVALHHSNRSNAFALADDVLEPFRPMVDLAVARLAAEGVSEVTREAKHDLVAVTVADMRTCQGVTPVQTCLTRLTQSLARAFECGTPALDLPVGPLPASAPAAGD